MGQPKGLGHVAKVILLGTIKKLNKSGDTINSVHALLHSDDPKDRAKASEIIAKVASSNRTATQILTLLHANQLRAAEELLIDSKDD